MSPSGSGRSGKRLPSLPERDRERIERALAAAERARLHAARFGLTWHEDEAAVDAISKAIEEVGENLIGTLQSPGVSAETRAAYPRVAWREIAGMRNVLVHGYHRRDLAILRAVLEDDLPGLIAELQAILR